MTIINHFYWRNTLIIQFSDEFRDNCYIKCFEIDKEWFAEDCRIILNNGEISRIETIGHMGRIGPTLLKEILIIHRKEKLEKLLS